MAVKNDPKTVAKLLRCVAKGTYATENKTSHIFDAAADLLDPPPSDVIPLFYVKGDEIFQRPTRGSKPDSIRMGFAVCGVYPGVDAATVCAIMNKGEPATE